MTAPFGQVGERSNHTLLVEYVPIVRVKLNPFNPKRHTKAKIVRLAESMAALGVNTPLIVDGATQLLSGEARLRACQHLGLKTVPVIRLEHLSPEEAQLYMLAEHRFGELGQMDVRAVGRLFKDLSVLNLEVSLEISGYEMPQIDLMIEKLELEDEQEDADAAPPSGPAVARPGDLFICHNPHSGLSHKVVCADALKRENYEQLLGAETLTAVITDPPFGGKISGYLTGQGTKHREFVQGSEGLKPDELEVMLEAALTEIARVCAPGALIYAFMDWRGIDGLVRAGRRAFAELKNIIVWNKTNAGMGTLYRSQHELIALFKVEGAHRNNIKLGATGRSRSNVWTYPGMTSTAARKTDEGDLLAAHPTVKPTQLIADALLDCTARGDLVGDMFLGSGTLLVSAERTGRQARGMELDPVYVDLALRRWRMLTGEEPVHAGTGKTFHELEQEAL